MRVVPCGGSAVPHSLMEAYEKEHGVTILQAWGMTETSPLGSVARPPVGVTEEESWRYRDTQGRLICDVEARLIGEAGVPLPHDGGRRRRGRGSGAVDHRRPTTRTTTRRSSGTAGCVPVTSGRSTGSVTSR